MKTALKLFLTALVLCLPSLRPAEGQEAIKARLDSIRQHRPTVALVLGGGGAKGAAEIGVLSYLDSLNVPVDLVMGTSIGGLIGGMYSVGIPWQEMKSVMQGANWEVLLSDYVSPRYIPYEKRRHDASYLISVPFQGAFDIKAGGMVSGFNVDLLLSRLTAGWHSERSFSTLPVPFVCVATDIVTGKPKVWYDGQITTALRSTMSIPALFAPVKTKDMVLVDGGLVDNFPTDIARALGADIVIAVDLSQGMKSYDEIKNIGHLLVQITDLPGRDVYENNQALADAIVHPKLKGYNMLSFNREAIDDMMEIGYRTAVDCGDTLAALARRAAAGRDSAPGTIGPGNYRYKALDENEIIAIDEEGDSLTIGDIEKKMFILFGTGAYEGARYTLEGESKPYNLKIHSTPELPNSVGVGIRSDNDELASVLLNVGYGVNALRGPSASVTGKLGINPSLALELKYKTRSWIAFGFDSFYRYVDRNNFRTADTKNIHLLYHNLRQELYLSTFTWSLMDFRAGAKMEFYNIKNVGHDAYFGLFARLISDGFDDWYYPSSGHRFKVYYSWNPFAAMAGSINLHRVGGEVSAALPLARKFTLIYSAKGYANMGDEIPTAYFNVLGGPVDGRYQDWHIGFAGLNNNVIAGNVLAVGRIDLRYTIAKRHYLSAIYNIGSDASSVRHLFGKRGDTYHGAALEYGWNGIAGPVKFGVGWNNVIKKPNAYFSIGKEF